MTIHPEQAKLLFHEDYRHYIRVYDAHESHGPLFVFGRVLRIEEYLARSLIADEGYPLTGLVKRYHENAMRWWAPAYTYSVLSPDGTFGFHSVVPAWPIPPALFRKAESVGWDLTNPDAPIGEVEEVIERMKEAMKI